MGLRSYAEAFARLPIGQIVEPLMLFLQTVEDATPTTASRKLPAFSVAGSRIINGQLEELTSTLSLWTIRQHLVAFLFRKSFLF